MKREQGIMRASMSDSISRFRLTNMSGTRKLLAGALGISGVLAAGITALAAGKSPVLPLQVPSSVSTPKPEGNPYGLTVVPPGFPRGGIVAPGDLLV
jgi:hypothetical protein